MTHSAGSEFFDEKREWSRRKDLLLEHYLPNYIPKVIHSLKKSLCIVDGCAGPGSFVKGDEPGSPRIICDIVEKARANPANFGFAITPFLIEQDPGLFARLRQRVGGFRGLELRNRDFRDCVDELEVRVTKHRESLFLYLDPFTVEALEWASLDRLFGLITQGHSVEILMNFNVAIFARIGLGALGMQLPVAAEDEGAALTSPSIGSLNKVAGGEWWLDILRKPISFEQQCRAITDGYCERLRSRFNEVCFHEIKDKVNAKQPKYVLVFGSRSGEALRLMNNAMAESLERFAAVSRPTGTLFEMLPKSVVPDQESLANIIHEQLAQALPRQELVLKVIRRITGVYTDKAIRDEIAAMVRAGRIQSATGPRMNDQTVLRRTGAGNQPFATP